MAKRNQDGLVLSFVGGLIAGVLVSTPVAAWLSPKRGAETRQDIRQRGLVIRRKAGTAVRKPIEQAQEQIEQLQEQVGDTVGKIQDRVENLQDRVKGDSVEDSLQEGKAIAEKRRSELTG